MAHGVLRVSGMTCGSCEARIEGRLRALPGLTTVQASQARGRVEFDYDPVLFDRGAVVAAIEAEGYTVGEGGAPVLISLGAGLLLVGAYLFASSRGLFSNLPDVDASVGYAALFVVGLLTSIHCVAMCGGLSLSQSLGTTPPDLGGRLARIKPGLLYNLGRLISYTAVGGVVGALGSVFQFSPLLKGLIAAAAGLFMLLLGLRMLGLLGFLGKVRFPGLRAPVVAASGLGARASSGLAARARGRGPLVVGLLGGLMPCGPLQTMQLYALGTGSFLSGALAMFLFGAGTIPLMLVFAATAALLPRRLLPSMVRASAVLVMFLGVLTFARAAALAGIALPLGPSAVGTDTAVEAPASEVASPVADPGLAQVAEAQVLKATVKEGVQSIVTVIDPNGYPPFAVQAGIPLRWTVRVKPGDLTGCNNTIIVPAYNIRARLKVGDTLIEFTPKTPGVIAFSCWMGMIRSRITVLSDLGLALPQGALALPAAQGSPPEASDQAYPAGASCCATGQGGSAGSGEVLDEVGIPAKEGSVYVATVTVGPDGYRPRGLVLPRGAQARIRFKVEALTSCNNPIIFPQYRATLDLAKGQVETPIFTVQDDFTFQCWMGMLSGYVKAVDSLSSLDLEALKAEIGADLSRPASCCGPTAAPTK